MATDTRARQRIILIAIDASDNAKDAFDCTYTLLSIYTINLFQVENYFFLILKDFTISVLHSFQSLVTWYLSVGWCLCDPRLGLYVASLSCSCLNVPFTPRAYQCLSKMRSMQFVTFPKHKMTGAYSEIQLRERESSEWRPWGGVSLSISPSPEIFFTILSSQTLHLCAFNAKD